MTLARITRLFSLTVSAVGLCALAHAQTAVQFGINRGTSPNQIGVYDSQNVFQPFMTMPATGGGPLTTLPSTTSKSGFNIAPGVAPTSPNNGDMWTTNSGMYVRINGITVGPLSETGSGSFAATFPLVVSFSEGVATYSLNYDSTFTVSNNKLALAPIAPGALLGNSSDSAAEPAAFQTGSGVMAALGNPLNGSGGALGTSLASADLFIGNSSGIAAGVPMSGDATISNTGALTLATSGVTAATYGDGTHSTQVTFDAKGRATSASSVTISPPISSVTGLGSNVASALAIDIGSSGSVVTNGGALGKPSGGDASNLTGTAPGLTVGNASNASALLGSTWASPPSIGSTTPNAGAFTAVTAGTGLFNSLTLAPATGGSYAYLSAPTSSDQASINFQQAGVNEWAFGQQSGAAPYFFVYNNHLGVNAFSIDYATNSVSVSATTASTSPTTGALTVAGGLGVAGAAWIGGAVNIGAAQTPYGQSLPVTESYPGLGATADIVRSVVGGFPVSDEYGAVGGTTSSIVGAVTTPSGTISGPHIFDAGVSGYAQTANVLRDAIGLFGEGGILVSGASAYGMNTEAINCENHSSTNCGPGKGLNFSAIVSHEADVSLYKVGTTEPTGNAYGYQATIFAETQPTGQLNAYAVLENTGIANAQPWKVGFVSADGAAGIGALFGASANPPTANLGSQPLEFTWYDGSVSQKFVSIYADGSGNLQVNSPAIFQGDLTSTTSSNTALQLNNIGGGTDWYLISNTAGNFQIYDGALRFNISSTGYTTIEGGASIIGALTLSAQPVLASSTTGAGSQTFTNSPCTGLTTEKWIPVSITGQTGTWYVPACQ